MPTMYDADPSELIEKAAEELKKDANIKPPQWAPFIKTGMSKERPPARSDWWHMRAASVLRTVYRLGPIGVSKLRTKYGGKKNRGHKMERTYKGSGNLLSKILQQLEKGGYIKKAEKGVHKGRVITAKGQSFLDKIATHIYRPVRTVAAEHKKSEHEDKAQEQKKPAAKKVQKAEQENAVA